jgi:hypothetical protein
MPRILITAEAVFGYKLYLRNQLGYHDSLMVFGPTNDVGVLKDMYERELVEPYQEEGPDLTKSGEFKVYTKYFRKGGSLEWCVPLDNVNQWIQVDADGIGIVECLLDIFNIEKKEITGK